MREALQTNIQDLNAGFLRMHSIVFEQLTIVRQAVQVGQLAGLGERVKELDRQIDRLEVELEDRILRVIALQQPVASDLRLMMLVLKSLADLERAGDYVAHVANNLEVMSREDHAAQPVDLLPLLAQLGAMVEKVGTAYSERDSAAAREAAEMDDVIDALYEQLQRSSMTRVLEDPRSIGVSLQLGSLARSAERCGDHLVNVAERMDRTFGLTR